MELQYLSDTQGRHTAVVIPIEDWNNLTIKHQDLKMLEKPQIEKVRKKPSDFRGSIAVQTAEALLQYTQQARTEWESHTF